jgi:HAE1 family hydrophobic/amphiphilic exporter-1
VFERMLMTYDRTLKSALAHPRTVVGIFAATVIVTAGLFVVVSKDFIPSTDTGQLLVSVEGPQNASFEYMRDHREMLSNIVAEDPNVASYSVFIGASGIRVSANQANMFLRLKDRSERKLSADEIIQELRPKFAQVPGVRVSIQNPPSIRIGGQITQALYQYTLQDGDLDELYHWTEVMLERFAQIPGFQDVTSNLYIASPSVIINIQRDKLATLGLTANQVEDALTSAFGTRQVSTIYGTTNQYQVILEVEPQYQNDPTALSNLYVRSSGGKLIPLDTVAHVVAKPQALTINHLGQLPSVTISFNLAPGVSLGDAVSRIKDVERELRPPISLSGSLQGAAQAFQSSLQGLGILLLVAVLVVYIVLGILYESFVHPLTILSGLPSAGVGALLTLFLFRVDLSLYAFVGVIMLIGIVKKNAIMMIDFALERQRNEGMAPPEAIYKACLIRFRPIMMTTMAALMGTLPIAIGFGAGGEARRPLGLAVVGGLLLSQVLTLYITPVIYVYLDKVAAKWSVRRGKTEPATG